MQLSSDDQGVGVIPLIPLAIVAGAAALATIGSVTGYAIATKPKAGDPVQPTLTGGINKALLLAVALGGLWLIGTQESPRRKGR